MDKSIFNKEKSQITGLGYSSVIKQSLGIHHLKHSTKFKK